MSGLALEPDNVFGQKLSGRVEDQKGNPLKGATIALLPANLMTISDSNGRYSLEGVVKGKHTLYITFVGLVPIRYPVVVGSADLVLHPLVMTEEVRLLQEVRIKKPGTPYPGNKSPLSNNLVDRDYLMSNLGGSLMQSMEKLPGIKAISIGSGNAKPLIRGLGFNQIVVIENGIRHEGQQWGADHGLEIDQFSVGKVEIIKGPSSFLYGSEAIGGAVNIVAPPVPALKSVGGALTSIGKSNNGLYGGSFNLYARQSHFFVDARITWQGYGDYRVPTDTTFVYDYAVALKKNRIRNTAGTEQGLHLRSGWISESYQSIFQVSKTYSNSGFFANAHGLEPRNVDTEVHDRFTRDILLPSQRVSHFKIINQSEIGIGKDFLNLELGYQRNYRQEHSQYVNHGFMPPRYPVAQPGDQNLEREYDKTVWSANLKTNLERGRHRVTIGTSGERQQNTIGGWGFLIPSFSQWTASFFAFNQITFNKRLSIQNAMRFDYGSITIQEYKDWFKSYPESGEGDYLTRANSISRTFKSLNWSLGLSYTRESVFLKVNAGTGFRMPIAKELAANGVNYHYFRYEKGDSTLSAEKSIQLDLGIGFRGKKLSLELTPYFNFFPNYIYLNPSPAHDYYYGAGNQVFNYAQSRVMRYGSELQVKYNILQSLRISLAGEYLYTRQLSGAKQGYALPFSPPTTALVRVRYSPKWDAFKDPYFTLDYRLTSPQDRIVPPEQRTPGYQLFSFSAGGKFKMKHQFVALSLQVQNLLNTRYLNHLSFYRLIGLPEQGRNLILSATIPFEWKKKG